jgi:hypothetical protein
MEITRAVRDFAEALAAKERGMAEMRDKLSTSGC